MHKNLKKTLTELVFDNRFTHCLPADPLLTNRRRQVKNACFSWVDPADSSNPELIALSHEMLNALDLDPETLDSQHFLQVFAGNQLLPGMQPYAMCYGGHQFGHWAGQLGDGRAIILGDVINNERQRWSLQLKGAGPTPYSRTADGYAVLRSSIREFLCSEAMFHLGVPTTRALSLVLSGEKVVRDMFYDGHPEYEPAAIVCRVAPSFTRFGNFQILTAQNDIENLTRLVDYTIQTDYPHLGPPDKQVYLEWFREICTRTADMVVHWMRVGFVHGVMNTDNMSILGLTIDYGPYGWLENYDPDWTPNTTDANGRRYRFSNQSQIAQWNLLQLAEAIYPLINETTPLELALQHYNNYYQQQWQAMMATKLGFAHSSSEIEMLAKGLLKLLESIETDMTLFYRALASFDLPETDFEDNELLQSIFAKVWYQPEQVDASYLDQLKAWLIQYRKICTSLALSEADRVQQMNSVNPKYVLRNYLAQQAIDKAGQGDYTMVQELLEVLRRPYDEQPEKEIFAAKRPEWARHRAGCSMLSCSS
ncbi:MAG: YdiU family protein [Gammaproteobacteria bacterium]|nr:YdiU family protein [Gammaproteobacteria bacterium]MBL7000066.1 YdiU family protein [Gammaproteobacteria bacterium]